MCTLSHSLDEGNCEGGKEDALKIKCWEPISRSDGWISTGVLTLDPFLDLPPNLQSKLRFSSLLEDENGEWEFGGGRDPTLEEAMDYWLESLPMVVEMDYHS